MVNKEMRASRTKVFMILDSIQEDREKFNEETYTIRARSTDPGFGKILDYFVSYNEMQEEFKKWRKLGGFQEDFDEQELILSSEIRLEDYVGSTDIDLKKISKFLTGNSSVTATETELKKIKTLLDNSSKAGNTFLSMMAYRQMERVSKLIDALELAESRMYSSEAILRTKPEFLGFLIERIAKTMESALTFIDRVSNREIEERKKGNSITINHTVNQINTVETKGGEMQISQPVRESFRALAGKLAKELSIDAQVIDDKQGSTGESDK